MRRLTAAAGLTLALAGCSAEPPPDLVFTVSSTPPVPVAPPAPGCHGTGCSLPLPTPEPSRASRSRPLTAAPKLLRAPVRHRHRPRVVVHHRLRHHVAQVETSGLPLQLRRIRSCESGPNGYASHGYAFDYNYTETNPGSTASGAFQFLDGTWRSASGMSGRAKDYSPAVQDRVALRYWQQNGGTPWAASRSCWGH